METKNAVSLAIPRARSGAPAIGATSCGMGIRFTHLATALLITAPCALSAQVAVLEGVVRAARDRHLLSCIPVALEDSAGHDVEWTRTDGRAFFAIGVPTAGVYRLRFGEWPSSYSPFDTVHVGEYRERAYEVRDEREISREPRPDWPGTHAQQVSGTASPRYPESERLANREGEVLVEYVIDSTGRVDMSSVQTRYASDIDFRDAVLDMLPQLRYHPATEHGIAVCERVSQPFTFQLNRVP